MTRAQQEATKVYGGSPELNLAFVHGYKKAEEQLALTWKDIQRIVEISDGLAERMDAGITEPYFKNEQTFYEELLRLFNQTREK